MSSYSQDHAYLLHIRIIFSPFRSLENCSFKNILYFLKPFAKNGFYAVVYTITEYQQFLQLQLTYFIYEGLSVMCFENLVYFVGVCFTW